MVTWWWSALKTDIRGLLRIAGTIAWVFVEGYKLYGLKKNHKVFTHES